MTAALTILQINDLHGYLEPHAEFIRTASGMECRTLGGLARIGGLFDRVRAEVGADHVLALDNGDTFHGTFLPVTTGGEAMIPMMNALALDAMTAHWEFAYGPAGFKRLAAKLDYPVLAINCFDKATGELVFAPYKVLTRAGLRLGVVGLACPIVDKTMPPSYSEGVQFTNGVDELPGWIDHLRTVERVDLLIVLSHLGYPQDVALAKRINGIDVLVSGHTHNRMYAAIVENGAIIFQSGCHGSFVGRLDLTVEDGRIVGHHHQLIPVDATIADNPGLATMIEAALAPHRATLEEVVGQTETPLDRYTMLQSSMDAVLLDAIAAASGREIAFSNGWRYGAPIPPGPITIGDLWNIIPTNPPVSVVDLTGQEMLDMLEANLERTFAAEPFEQMGGYVKRCRGLHMYLKAENPKGHRIEQLFVGDALVDPAQTYAVAFVTAQGVPAKFGRNRRNLDISAIDALKAYFAASGPVRGHPRETVTAI